jgi:hypothetical protein
VEALLKNRSLLREKARTLLKDGVVPAENGWGGWLGRYHAALARTVAELKLSREGPWPDGNEIGITREGGNRTDGFPLAKYAQRTASPLHDEYFSDSLFI